MAESLDRREIDSILTSLAKLEHLPQWERAFVRTLSRHKTITPREQTTLLELRENFLRKGAAYDSEHGEAMPPD